MSETLSRQAQDRRQALWNLKSPHLLSTTSWLGSWASCTSWPLMNHWLRSFSAHRWSPTAPGDPGLGVHVSRDLHTPLHPGTSAVAQSPFTLLRQPRPRTTLGSPVIHSHSIGFWWFWPLWGTEHMTQVWPIRVALFPGWGPDMTQSK